MTNFQCCALFLSDFSVKSILCDPNWSKSKWFVTMNDHNVISVWDLDTESVCRGHKAHQLPQYRNDADDASGPPTSSQINSNGGVMCITKERQVLSIDGNNFVKYCLVSNTYSMLCNHIIQKAHTVCALKSSPYDSDIVAVGYRNGLILIVDVKRSALLQKLRGHESEIISLEWMLITPANAQPIEISPESRPIDSRRWMPGRDAPKPIVDEGDMFDIFADKYLKEEEFGSILERVKNDTEDSTIDAVVGTGNDIANNKNFDFIEACASLRNQIVCMDTEKESPSDAECSPVKISVVEEIVVDSACTDGVKEDSEAVNDSKEIVPALASTQKMSEAEKIIADFASTDDVEKKKKGVKDSKIIDPANASTRSTIGSTQDVAEFADIENALSELKIKVDSKEKIYLASGAREAHVVIWNVEEGTVSDKLMLKVQHGKMAIPSKCSESSR